MNLVAGAVLLLVLAAVAYFLGGPPTWTVVGIVLAVIGVCVLVYALIGYRGTRATRL